MELFTFESIVLLDPEEDGANKGNYKNYSYNNNYTYRNYISDEREPLPTIIEIEEEPFLELEKTKD